MLLPGGSVDGSFACTCVCVSVCKQLVCNGALFHRLPLMFMCCRTFAIRWCSSYVVNVICLSTNSIYYTTKLRLGSTKVCVYVCMYLCVHLCAYVCPSRCSLLCHQHNHISIASLKSVVCFMLLFLLLPFYCCCLLFFSQSHGHRKTALCIMLCSVMLCLFFA